MALAAPRPTFGEEEAVADPDTNTFTINVTWPRVEGATGYHLIECLFPEDWATAAKTHAVDSGDTTSLAVSGLREQSTYQFKLVVLGADGAESEPSDVVAYDTLVANCAPTNKCCTIS